tara:strand:+ start:453 stop:758 length:306 start_codon:yes stop_codon:yes gene_type:complete
MLKIILEMTINLMIFLITNVLFTMTYMNMGPENFTGFEEGKEYTFIDWFYLTSTTTSTVGFGDHYPITQKAKITVILHQFIVLINLTSITSRILEKYFIDK